MSSNGEERKVVEAQSFVLRGRDGKLRAMLALSESDEPFFALFDSDENPKATLRVANGLPTFFLQDQEGRVRVTVDVPFLQTPSGEKVQGAAIRLADETNTGSLVLAVLPHEGGPQVIFYGGEDAKERIIMGTIEGGSVMIYDAAGKKVWEAPPEPKKGKR